MSTIEPAPAETLRTVHNRAGDPCVLVIFGGSGDLTRRKLVPAIFNLARTGLLPRDFAIVAFAKDDLTAEHLRERLKEGVAEFLPGEFPAEKWAEMEKKIYYLQADFQDSKAYAQLGELLARCDQEHQTQGNYLYYLATPPSMFAPIIQHLGKAKLAREGDENHPGWRRVIIEKPFGRDLASARALNKVAQKAFAEHQIYRIDHYLGKETVQNVMLFRFANGMFEPIWNRRYIDHVEITVAETLGVEGRGRYYEEAGVLRDMIQNHMFQLLALIAMEPPHSFAAEAVRDEKVKVLHAIRPLSPEEILSHTVRGQYGPGSLSGQTLPGYRAEPNVSPQSHTETYAA
ncbi:MAG TPA: glucose-6-phosphate dehydrogenase, partial [Planctomycetota bacterium]|nr:glucose-6-phosphate dehydrogenase [Planctomycetota bacterium]